MAKKVKRSAVCPKCGLECIEQESLQRHLDWAHREKDDKSITNKS